MAKLIPMPDKPKAKTPRQVSLLDAAEDKPDDLDRMVAQAFDSDPAVRLRIANALSKTDDPRAIFALIELSADKDEAVKGAAQRSLGNFKDEKEEIVSIGKLLSERKAQPGAMQNAAGAPQQQTPAQQTAHANMMPAIERLFAHYEPKKRESAKRKLLPSLQKLFGFRPEELDPLRELDKISGSQQPRELERAGSLQRQSAREAAEKEGAPQNAANFPFGKHEEPRELPRRAEHEVEVSEEDTEVVGEMLSSQGEGEAQRTGLEEPDDIYHYALRIATTPGMGKADLKRESNRMISDFRRKVELAFRIAFEQAREEGCATFSSVKPGMKNLSFSEMQISSITEIAYGPKRKPYARIMLFDGKREMALLVPRERAAGITTNDRVAAKKVAADFIVEKSEVVLLVGTKSAVVVYK
ncbi:MAG: HEAT repeat domain-containing protein [Candidatus Micrarchaeota archaeon]|nr:HEAT repeat domain-containing protein [Candidatus Micrarchaeota archaeon]